MFSNRLMIMISLHIHSAITNVLFVLRYLHKNEVMFSLPCFSFFICRMAWMDSSDLGK